MRAKTHFSSVKRVIAMALAVLMVVGVFQVGSHINNVKAATGDTPPHTKNIHDNGDGTYTISLDIVGESEKKPNNVNVIVIFDRSGSMTNTRMTAAKNAVNNLANSLYAYNTSSAPDTVQMALVDFSTHAHSNDPTTSLTTFRSQVNNLTANGGTNWEAALNAANSVNFGDDDQTFVIFVSDGNPTFRDTQGTTRITDNRWYNYDNIYYQQDGVYGLGSDNPNNQNYSPQSMGYCYNHAVDDAQTLVTKVGADHFFTIGAYGNVDRMEDLTDDAGSDSTTNFYNANDTAALNQALSDILAKIETMGFADAEIDDGTTNQVTTTSGRVAELLELVPNFKYYRSGGSYGTNQPWADAPEAKVENGEVVWDLSSEGVLENGVRYTVTFDCYPSQETYDTIAKLKNGDMQYSELVEEGLDQYIVDNGGGSYSLRTNTNAGIQWDDTRDDEGRQSSGYTNPDPVKTDAETLKASKEWEGGDPDVDELEITVLMDDEPFHSATISKDNDWSTESFISIGIIKDGQVLPGAEGHNFKFAELGDEQYHWELESPVVRPMLIDGTKTMLIMVDATHPAPSGATTYTIGGKTYYVDSSAAGLTAINHRRSNLNLKKIVTGEDAPEDATFPFTLTVNNSKAPSSEPTDDPDHNSDYWVWFSIYDTKAGAAVTDATVSGATGPNADGYYYAPNNTAISVEMKADWNLRFINLPSGTTYTFVEGTMPEGFAFKEAKNTAGDDSTFVGGKTSTGTIETTKTSYAVEYTNDYALTNLEITKVWEDNDDQDGMRLTADELKEKLTLSPAVDGAEPTVVDNEDGTYTITYTGLPRFNNGEEVEYTVTEAAIDGYDPTGSPAKDHGTITNTHEPITTTVTVTKSWEDDNNANETRPDSISVQLKADEENVGEAQTLNEAGEWKYTWEDLPAYADGEEIAYSVDEVAVEGYTTTVGDVTGDVETGYEIKITNSNVTIPTDTDTFFKKTVTEGTEGKAATFTFTISGSDGAPMPANTSGSVTYAAGETGDKTIDFGTITFSKEGTYTYTITEGQAPAGWTASGSPATVTVTVSKDDSGKLSAEVSAGAITNAYATGTVSVDPPVKKDITGTEELYNKGDFTFTIENTAKPDGVEEAPMPSNTSITNRATYELEGKKGYYEFGEITFSVPGTYKYKVTEEGSVLGVTNDTDPVDEWTFTVTDNGDGTLSVTPGSDEAVFEFTNEYKTGELDITKTVVNEINSSDTTKFTFTVEIKDAEGKAVDGEFPYTIGDTEGTISSGDTLQLGNGETAKITGIPDGASYTVTETSIPSGYENTSKSGDTGTIDATTPAEAAFTNTYGVDPTKFELKASKTLEVEDPANNPPDISGKYEFTIKADAPADAPLPATTTVTNPDGEGGEFSFGEIEYTKPGDYQYTITESGKVDGVTNGQTSYTVKVSVTDKGDGSLEVKVTDGKQVTAFTNTYKVKPVKLEKGFEVTKKVTGTTLSAGAFEFKVTGDAPLPDPATATNDDEGKVTFNTITYDTPGTYTYEISEIDGGNEAYTYDTHKVTVTVKVTDNGKGELVAEVSYDGETTFENSYKASGSVELSVEKKLTGRALEEGQFTFELLDENGEVLQTKTNNASGAVQFDAIKYDQTIFDDETEGDDNTTEGNSTDDTPTQQSEEVETAPAVEDEEEPVADEPAVEEPVDEEEAVEEIIVEEEALEEPAEVEEAESEEDEIVTLSEEDEYVDTEEFIAEEAAEEEPVTDEEVFEEETEVEETEDEEPVIEEVEEEPVIEEAEEEAEEAPADEIELAEKGRKKEFTYTIREVNDGKPGYFYDDHEVTVTVTVTDDDEGNLEAVPAYVGSTTFTNKYEAEGEAQFEGTKTVEGTELKDGQFSFQLKKGNEVLETVKNDADGNFTFEALNYDQDDAGKTFEYTIVEVNDGQTGYTYDDNVCDVTVEVTDNGDGTLACDITYSDGEKAQFNNPYKPLATSVKIEGTKKLTGKKLTDGMFTFELKDENGEVIDTTTNKADGTITFKAIEFDEEGTFTYTVTEVQGKEKNMTYDETEYEITITVEDVDGQLTAEVEGGDGIEFKNKYTEPEPEPEPDPEPPTPTPPTGDRSMPWLWLAIMLAAGLELASLIYVRVRKNK